MNDWVAWVVGAFIIGVLLGVEWAAHNAADINRADAVPFNDHADEAIDLTKVVIP